MNRRAGMRWSRMSTPTNCTRPRVWRDSCARCGASTMHGPHHEAQMFTTTGSPWRFESRVRNEARSNVGSAVGDGGSVGVPSAEPEPPPHAAVSTTTATTSGRAVRRMLGVIVPVLHGLRAVPVRWTRPRAMLRSNPMAASLDAATLRRAMELFAEGLRRHRDELNSLNVFPVPDGDPGTNMLLTQQAVVAELDAMDGRPAELAELGEAISRASLLGARGNSGVILSQVLRGMFERLPGGPETSPADLATALAHAWEEAHHAVAKPRDG